MTKRNWLRTNTENLDYQHKMAIERRNEEFFNRDQRIYVHPKRELEKEIETKNSFIESFAFVFKPPALIFKSKPKLNSKSLELAWKTLPSIAGIAFESQLKINAKPGKSLKFDKPLITPLKIGGAEMQVSINDDYIGKYFANENVDNIDLIRSCALILRPPMISDKIAESNKEEVKIKLKISPVIIASSPSMTVTIQRIIKSKEMEKSRTYSLSQEGLEIHIGLSNDFITRYAA